MSFYTIFDTLETNVTTTSTGTTFSSTDLMIMHNASASKKLAVTAGAVLNPGIGVIATTNTTGTTIPNNGTTLLKSTGGSSCTWLLADPTAPGQVKTLAFVSTTTSTLYSVSTVTASILSSAGFAGTLVNFGSTQTGQGVNSGQSITLASVSSTQWVVIARNSNATSVTSGLVQAAFFGPYFS